MSKPKHTPGPWMATGDGTMSAPERWCVYANEAPVGHRMPAECTGPDAEANARLIAAAPEMLEALKAVLSFDGHPMSGVRAERMARAAIAKVEGES